VNRRGFLQSILVLGVAPVVVRADSLMRIVPRDTLIMPPGSLWVTPGDGDLIISWDPVAGAESYELQWGRQELLIGRAVTIRNNYTVTGLGCGVPMNFTVKALNS
jgi:hypothetical protein